MIMKGFRFREMDIVEELRQNRDSGAKRLVSEYKAGLMSLARRFCVNESDAEELVNATFAKVVDNIDDYLEQSAFFAWMCQILTNLFRESVRRKSNKNEIFSGDVPEVAEDPTASLRPAVTVDKHNERSAQDIAELLLARMEGRLPAEPQARIHEHELVVLNNQ